MTKIIRMNGQRGVVEFMEIKKKSNHNIFKILLIVFALSFTGVWIFFSHQNNILKTDEEGLEYVKFLSDGIERTTVLTLKNSSDTELYENMVLVEAALLPVDANYKYFANNREIIVMISKLKYTGLVFKKAALDYKEYGDEETLVKASENSYNSSNEVIEEINKYIDEMILYVDSIKTILIAHFTIIIGILGKLLFDKLSELQRNKVLTRDMKIDLVTGVYNRVKCQELLKEEVFEEGKEKVILIFELNNMPENNHSSNSEVNNELLLTFARQLKKTTTIFDFEIFVGRYGENKFMVYFLSSDEKDVEVFLEDINYLIDRVNIIEKKSFKISFSVGYIITTERMKSFTMQQLFDIADQNMSINKIAMEAINIQELEAK